MIVDGAARSFFANLGRLTGAAETASAERLSASAWAHAVETLAPNPKQIENAALATLSRVPALPTMGRAELESLLSNGSIKYTSKPAEMAGFTHIKTGIIQSQNGEIVPIVERSLTPQKTATELKVAKISELMPFSNISPVTVPNGASDVIQQRVGMSLEEWASRTDHSLLGVAREWNHGATPFSFSRSMKSMPFREQMLQTQVQRSILGDFDSTPANFGIALQNRRIMIANLDMNQALELVARPAAPNISSLRGMQLSSRTISAVERFAQFQRTAAGSEALHATGASSQELHYMLKRTEWYLKYRQLGPL